MKQLLSGLLGPQNSMKSHLSFGNWNMCPLLGFAVYRHVMQLSLGTVPSSTVYKDTCTLSSENGPGHSVFCISSLLNRR